MEPKRFSKRTWINKGSYAKNLGSILKDQGSPKSRKDGESEFSSSISETFKVTLPKYNSSIIESIVIPEDYATETEKVRNPKFSNLLDKMAKIHNKKNQDYASDSNTYSNFEFAATYAQVPLYKVYLVLEGIKTARLHELLGKGKTAQNESIDDTLLDKAIYAAIAASNLMKDNETKPQSTTKDGNEF